MILPFNLGVIILAAGESRRMGSPKMLLPWKGSSVIGHLIAQWKKLEISQLAVVHASGNQALMEELNRLDFPNSNRIPNPTPELGMFGSIQCAARWQGWQPDLTHWMIVLGDQPHLEPQTLRSLLEYGKSHPETICQLTTHDRPRHPVLLPKKFKQLLARASDENLHQFLLANSTSRSFCEVNDPGLDLDMDSPKDYQKLTKIFET